WPRAARPGQPASLVRSARETVRRSASAPAVRSIARTLSSLFSERTVVRTPCPAFSSWRTTWLPTKPLPPVTSTVLIAGSKDRVAGERFQCRVLARRQHEAPDERRRAARCADV